MFRNTGANAFAKNQTRLAYEDKRDLYCICGGIGIRLFMYMLATVGVHVHVGHDKVITCRCTSHTIYMMCGYVTGRVQSDTI